MKYNPTGLAHIGVPCADIHKTIDFYKEFGFEVTAIAENLNGFDVVILQNGTCTIEAYHPLDEEINAKNMARADGHVDHIAMWVDNLDDLYQECQDKGYEIVSDGIEHLDVFAPKTCRYFFITGPSQERLEFAQLSD